MPSSHQFTTVLYLGVCAPILTITSARLIVYLHYTAKTTFEQVIQTLADYVNSYPWVSEVAGILPLSALIDFVDVPQKLHIHQLVSAVPHWSWPVTPAGSRLLLEDAPTQQECVLDRFGRSTGLQGLDGAFGVKYFVMNPETIRLIMDSLPVTPVENKHDNMNMEKSAMRIQNLQVLFVSRNPPGASSNNNTGPRSRWLRSFSSWQSIHSSISYQLTSLLGWIALLGCLAAAIIFQLHIATAFLVLMPATGLCISTLYPGSPRKLLKGPRPNEPTRMVIVTEHMNSADWIAFYGPSTVVNSLLNTPLEPSGTSSVATNLSPKKLFLLRTLLRVFVIGQWALAVGAAATKDWNSFFISFWVFFCNVTHGYVIPPSKQAGAWAGAKGCANLRIERVAATVSTRRALLSTLVALNPDSFKEVKLKKKETATTEVVVPLEKKGFGSGSGSESSGDKSATAGGPGDACACGCAAGGKSAQVQVQEVKEDDLAKFPEGTTKWIDPILPTGASRTEWEKAMRKALLELAPVGWDKNDFKGLDRVLEPERQKKLCKVETEVEVKENAPPVVVVKKLPALSETWNAEYMDKRYYWNRYVSEGIYMAAKIREMGKLPEEKVGFGSSVV